MNHETQVNTPLLAVRNLAVDYKTDLETVHAVNGVSFRILKGKTYGLVGETGAGKTTTALSILNLLPSTTARINTGQIEFKGENIFAMDEAKVRNLRGNKIAMIFQDPMTSLNPVMTVSEQIGEAISIHNPQLNKEEIDARVDHTLNMVGILPLRKTEYPHQFSGGMKQRVVIAMALACEPDLLIADEPTTALDVTIQAQVLMMIKELRTRLGTSMLMITHDLGIIARTCDEVGVMYAGKIIESGTAKDIFLGKRHHPYTEGLFGSIPNLKLKADRLKPIPGLMPDPTNLPDGCVFAPRCKYCMDLCLTVPPPVITEGTHSISCHLFTEEQANQAAREESRAHG